MTINPNNNAHLKVGDQVVCTKDVDFSDGTSHKRGMVYNVEPASQAYFSLFTSDVSRPWACYLKIIK